MTYTFTEEEMDKANDEWGCNCGPSALAFALRLRLDDVRYAIPDFDAKRYTSPTMMKQALANLGRTYQSLTPVGHDYAANMFNEAPALVRIQWGGPWTQANANPKWAYRQTHWIATFKLVDCPCVFDCNGGQARYESWVRNIVPLITQGYPRADGTWWPTHIWRIVK